MNRSSEEIEREVEAARSDLDRTVDALKEKMSPGQLIDELSRSFKGGGAGEMMTNLGAQARENPMALAMIGAGIAWLMSGKAEGSVSPAASRSFAPSTASGDTTQGPTVGERLASAADTVTETVGDATDGLRDAASGMAGHASESIHGLGDQAAAAGRKAARTFDDILQQEPLIVGALGLAVGVAIGAAFPSTPMEDRAFGATRDKLVDGGEQKLAEVSKGLGAAGGAALDAVKSEADRQGLTGGESSLVDKTEAVIRSGIDAAREQLDGTSTT